MKLLGQFEIRFFLGKHFLILIWNLLAQVFNLIIEFFCLEFLLLIHLFLLSFESILDLLLHVSWIDSGVRFWPAIEAFNLLDKHFVLSFQLFNFNFKGFDVNWTSFRLHFICFLFNVVYILFWNGLQWLLFKHWIQLSLKLGLATIFGVVFRLKFLALSF